MSLRHALLGLLAHGPASGYDLLKAFDVSLANVWPATQSQVYGELARLSGGGLISVAAEGPRGRKEYAITDAGRAELRHWIIEVPPGRVTRSDQLLRVFFLDQIDPGQAEDYLRAREAAAATEHARYDELREQVDASDEPLAITGRIALEWGLRFTEMQREWAAWALDRLHSRVDPN
jgi:DNA-binding PadR family transcriptional regulator